MKKKSLKTEATDLQLAADAAVCLEWFAGTPRSWKAVFTQVLLHAGVWASARCKLRWVVKASASGKPYPKLLATNNPLQMLPTVVAADGSRKGEQVSGRRKKRDSGMCFGANLCDLARSGLLPATGTGSNLNNHGQTVRTDAPKRDTSAGNTYAITLTGDMLPKQFKSWSQVPYMYRLLPTPTAREHMGGRHPDTLARAGRTPTNSLGDAINVIAGKCCKLNPLFISEMMGYRPNWTLLPFQRQ